MPSDQQQNAPAELSERESMTVRLIALGYSNKQIATRFRVSVKTVETYKARAMDKMGIRSRVELMQFAIRSGWMTVESAAEIIAEGGEGMGDVASVTDAPAS
jgi:DNA-binding NarL/FixJ family response regulator